MPKKRNWEARGWRHTADIQLDPKGWTPLKRYTQGGGKSDKYGLMLHELTKNRGDK